MARRRILQVVGDDLVELGQEFEDLFGGAHRAGGSSVVWGECEWTAAGWQGGEGSGEMQLCLLHATMYPFCRCQKCSQHCGAQPELRQYELSDRLNRSRRNPTSTVRQADAATATMVAALIRGIVIMATV